MGAAITDISVEWVRKGYRAQYCVEEGQSVGQLQNERIHFTAHPMFHLFDSWSKTEFRVLVNFEKL